MLIKCPDFEEIKHVMFNINVNSSLGQMVLVVLFIMLAGILLALMFVTLSSNSSYTVGFGQEWIVMLFPWFLKFLELILFRISDLLLWPIFTLKSFPKFWLTGWLLLLLRSSLPISIVCARQTYLGQHLCYLWSYKYVV